MNHSSSLSFYLNESKSKYFYICHNSSDKTNICGGFCWLWFESKSRLGYDYFISQNFKYQGYINFRKIKLEKLNYNSPKKQTTFIFNVVKKVKNLILTPK